MTEFWSLRLNQRLEEARQWLEAQAGAYALPDVKLHQCSMLRFDRQFNDAQEILNDTSLMAAAPFQFHFQKAMLHFQRGKFIEALDAFLSAKARAKTKCEVLYTLANILFCFENLGMDTAHTLGELKALETTIDTDSLAKSFIDQMAAFEMRQSFRFNLPDFQNGPVDGQAFYYRSYLAEFPFFTVPNFDKEKSLALIAVSDLYNKQYRLRTLQGIEHLEDNQNIMTKDWAERLYLWTWRWLDNPSNMTFKKVLGLLRQISFLELKQTLSAEDFFQVRNSLLWISFFSKTDKTRLLKLIESIDPGFKCQKDIYNLEMEIICGEMENSSPHPHLVQAAKLVRKKNQPELQPAAQLFISPSSSMVMGLGRQIISDPIAQTFSALKNKNPLSFSEISELCFGHRYFDSHVDSPRIYNVISRMKSLLPDGLKLSTKNNKLYAIGSWDNVQIEREECHLFSIEAQNDWREFLYSRPKFDSPIKHLEICQRLIGKTEIRREDLELLVNKSRSTANRIISCLIKKGYLSKTGTARNTKYTVKIKA